VQKDRPVNLDLRTIAFPVTAIVSILHRISGVLLFLFVPVLLCLLDCSLKSAESFSEVQTWFNSLTGKVIIWALLSSLVFHLFAGVRHLLADMGFGESLGSARCSARTVLLLSIIVIVLLGVWLW